MTDKTVDTTERAPVQPADQTKPKKEEGPFWKFLLKLVLVVVIFRSFIFAPFTIPSESMLPALWKGDYLFVSKWAYGYTKYSMPFNAPMIPGRILASAPERGDVAVFKHPIDKTDYIKRVIGVPGDRIQMQAGQLFINGEAVEKKRVEDFIIPLSENTVCDKGEAVDLANGERGCRYIQYVEILPGGRTYRVLDMGQQTLANQYGINPDSTAPVVVPEGSFFAMGDHRDNSQDSRFPAAPRGGVGMVDQELLVGRASAVAFSTDGSASWLLPWTWFSAARWDRIGKGV